MIRVHAIVRSDGYMLKASYASPASGTSFRTVKSVQAINQSVDYCDPNADTCTGLTKDWRTQTFSTSLSGTTIINIINDPDNDATAVVTVACTVKELTQPHTITPGKQQHSHNHN